MMKVTVPLAHKIQEAIQNILQLMELGKIDKAKSVLLKLSALVTDQTVKVADPEDDSDG
jgi:hypothetical protein